MASTIERDRDKATVRRVQMDLSADSFERLNKLKQSSDASSYTEVIKAALKAYEYLIEQDEAEARFFVQPKDGSMTELKFFT